MPTNDKAEATPRNDKVKSAVHEEAKEAKAAGSSVKSAEESSVKDHMPTNDKAEATSRDYDDKVKSAVYEETKETKETKAAGSSVRSAQESGRSARGDSSISKKASDKTAAKSKSGEKTPARSRSSEKAAAAKSTSSNKKAPKGKSAVGNKKTVRSAPTFSADAAAQAPAISGPATFSRSEPAGPEFFVSVAKGRFWAVEIASELKFLKPPNRDETTEEADFYGSWESVPQLPKSAGPTTFVLPSDAWEELRRNEELYFRVVTSSSASAWTDVVSSSTGGDSVGKVMLTGRFERLPERVTRPEETNWRV